MVDLRTDAVSGEAAIEVANPYDVQPLGDGSWLTGNPDGSLVRRPRALPSLPPHPAD